MSSQLGTISQITVTLPIASLKRHSNVHFCVNFYLVGLHCSLITKFSSLNHRIGTCRRFYLRSLLQLKFQGFKPPNYYQFQSIFCSKILIRFSICFGGMCELLSSKYLSPFFSLSFYLQMLRISASFFYNTNIVASISLGSSIPLSNQPTFVR